MKQKFITTRAIFAAFVASLMAACSGGHAMPPGVPGTNAIPASQVPAKRLPQATVNNATLTLSVASMRFQTLESQQTFTASVNSGMVVYASSSDLSAATVSPSSGRADPTHPVTFTVTSKGWGGSTIVVTNKLGLTSSFLTAVSPWIQKAPHGSTDAEMLAAPLNGRLYVAEDNIGYAPIETKLQAYDPPTNSWQAYAPLTDPRINYSVAAANGLFYIIGGWDQHFNMSSSVEAYNPATNSWTTKAPLPVPGENGHYNTAATVNGTIYAVMDTVAYGSNYVLYAYNVSADKWTALGSVPVGYSFVRVAAIGKLLYAVDNDGTVAIYNPAGKTWTLKTQSRPVYIDSVAAVDNTLYAISTFYNVGLLPVVYAYNAGTNTWAKVNAPTPAPYFTQWTGTVGNTIYLFCGPDPWCDHTYAWTPGA